MKKWISVNDKLPKEGQLVVVMDKWNGLQVAKYYKEVEDKFVNCPWHATYVREGRAWYTGVTHWSPLNIPEHIKSE